MVDNGNDSGSAQREEQGPNPGLKTDTTLWETPNIPSRGPETAESKKKGGGGCDLQTSVENWATPGGTEDKRADQPSPKNRGRKDGEPRHTTFDAVAFVPPQQEVTTWAAPNTPNGGRMPAPESMSDTGQKPDVRKGQVDLNHQTFLWSTPAASKANDGETSETWEARAEELKEKKINGNGAGAPLPIMPQQFHGQAPSPQAPALDLTALYRMFSRLSKEEMRTAAIAFLRSLQSGRSGSKSSRSGPTLPPQLAKRKRRRLNTKFVQWLMSFPEGWTSAEPMR